MYESNKIREFYNQYGEKEWERLNLTAYDRINYHLHMHFLKEHIESGKKVLDAGCGAGRFSIELAKLGCMVTLLDISDQQLKIAKKKLQEEELISNVDDIINADFQ